MTEKERGANLKVEYSQETGKKNTGYESRGKDGHGPTATAKTTCGVCGVQGAIFKKVRINVVVR